MFSVNCENEVRFEVARADSNRHGLRKRVPKSCFNRVMFSTGGKFKAGTNCAKSEFQIHKISRETTKAECTESLDWRKSSYGGRRKDNFSASQKSRVMASVPRRGNRNDYHKGWKVSQILSVCWCNLMNG